MNIPQNILNTFIIRADYLEWIRSETSIIAYLDLTNMFYWQDVLGWKFRLKDIVAQLFSFPNVKEVKVYYGKNEFDEETKKESEVFHRRILTTGAILRTKKVKFIPKPIDQALVFKRSTRTLFDEGANRKLAELVEEIKKIQSVVHEPKCNFDVEMAMDMMDDAGKISAIMLFSGDSDLLAPLERLKITGKKIGIVGVRGMVATELHGVKDQYIDFGKFYTGKRTYKSENPAFGGTA